MEQKKIKGYVTEKEYKIVYWGMMFLMIAGIVAMAILPETSGNDIIRGDVLDDACQQITGEEDAYYDEVEIGLTTDDFNCVIPYEE